MLYPPRKTYLLPVVFWTLLAVVFFMVEQWASNTDFWDKFPFGWLAWIGLAFMAGLIIEDCTNEDSWLRKTVRSFFQVFTIELLTTPSKNTPDNEWLEILLRIRIIKNVKNANIVLTAHSCMNIAHARDDFILEKRDAQNLFKDETLDFTLGALSVKQYNGKPPIYDAWGSKVRLSGDTDGMHSLHGGTENLVEIDVRSGWFKQTETIFIATLQLDAGCLGRVFLARDTSPASLSFIPKYRD